MSSKDKDTTKWLYMEIERVTVLRMRSGPDRISFQLPDATARKLHGDLYEFWKEASFEMRVSRGEAESVLKRMGIDMGLVTVTGPGAG